MPASPPNLLLITVDCLRPDVLGCYGGVAATPNMDRLAKGGVRYLNAYSHAHFTRPAFAALFSGAYPWKYGGNQRLSPQRPDLPETLQRNGYQTLGVNSNTWLSTSFGYGRGFTVYRDLSSKRPIAHSFPVVALNNLLGTLGAGLIYPPYPGAETLTATALELLEHARSPYFLWLHYMNAHWPYDLSRPRLYAPWDRHNRVYRTGLAHRARREPQRVQPYEKAGLLERYLRAVEHVDREVGRLLEAAGDSAVVITSDHGEAFGEHGRYFHDPGLYTENVHVPLILRAPQIPAGKVEERIVRHVDILPTLLDLAQCPSIENLAGISLMPAARGEGPLPDLEAVAVIEDPQNRQRWIGIRHQGWVALFLYRRGSPTAVQAELYQTEGDPREQVNLADRFPDRLQAMQARAASFFEAGDLNGPVTPEQELDPEIAERLRALGYLE
jgi:arylsulfatase A-like enzyme